MAKMILIRHGETDWNRERRYLSFTDIELNAQGAKQATAVGKRLAGERLERVYSSPSLRAFDFAKLALGRFPVEITPALKEMNFGAFEGMDHVELMRKYPEDYKKWLADPLNSIIPQGEAPCDFKERVMKAFGRIVSSNKNANTAIVTHGGPIRMFVSAISGVKDIWQIQVDPAGITIVEFDSKLRAQVVMMNDTSHLKDG